MVTVPLLNAARTAPLINARVSTANALMAANAVLNANVMEIAQLLNVAKTMWLTNVRLLAVSVKLVVNAMETVLLLSAAKTAARELKSQAAAVKSSLSDKNRDKKGNANNYCISQFNYDCYILRSSWFFLNLFRNYNLCW